MHCTELTRFLAIFTRAFSMILISFLGKLIHYNKVRQLSVTLGMVDDVRLG